MDEIYKRMHDDTEIVETIDEPSEIQQFFAGKSIFLTGATGFVGKVLVEKLLRSCSDLNKLFFLVRPKKQSFADRMRNYFDNPIFDKLKAECPDYQSKIVALEGDLSKENLGLSEEDKTTIIEEVAIIYHNASCVKFDEKISVAIRSNVLGVKYMLSLAEKCKKIVSFVYVSTAYSHCYLRHIEDKFYRPPADMKMILDILSLDESMPNGIDEAALQNLRHPWPNNYVFTKATAESLVEEFAKKVPFSCIVYRPSMVMSTYKEPIRGWCGNVNGPVGALLGYAIGFTHAIYKRNAISDYVPADMCANALIATTWDAAVNEEGKSEGAVYNYGSSVINQISTNSFSSKTLIRGYDLPSSYTMGPYYMVPVDSYWSYLLVHFTIHLIPALLADFILTCSGEKPRLLGFWNLLTKNLSAMMYFLENNWRIHVTKMQTVWKRMNKRDSQLFFCDLRELDWDQYSYSYWAGLRVYILRDPIETAEGAKLKYSKMIKILNIFYNIVKYLVIFYVLRLLISSYVKIIVNINSP